MRHESTCKYTPVRPTLTSKCRRDSREDALSYIDVLHSPLTCAYKLLISERNSIVDYGVQQCAASEYRFSRNDTKCLWRSVTEIDNIDSRCKTQPIALANQCGASCQHWKLNLSRNMQLLCAFERFALSTDRARAAAWWTDRAIAIGFIIVYGYTVRFRV